MLRTLVLAAALGAMALPAAAATTVTINVNGLDGKAAHAVITRAAKDACQVELRGSSPFAQYYLRADCINTAVADAEARLRTTRASENQTHMAGR